MLITLHSNGYEVAVNTMGAELKSFRILPEKNMSGIQILLSGCVLHHFSFQRSEI